MQYLFILPITYFINRLLHPYSMSYIRLFYDETILIEFNGSKLKINSFLPQSNRHTSSPFLSSSSSSFYLQNLNNGYPSLLFLFAQPTTPPPPR